MQMLAGQSTNVSSSSKSTRGLGSLAKTPFRVTCAVVFKKVRLVLFKKARLVDTLRRALVIW